MAQPEVREHSGFIAVGIHVRTSNALESRPDTARIPQLWQRYFQETVGTMIPHKKPTSPPMGLYTNFESDHSGEYTLVIGHEVERAEGTLPDGMQMVEVRPTKYLVFLVKGNPPASVKLTWEEIGKFFDGNKEFQRTCATDFEIYQADGAEILIGVR